MVLWGIWESRVILKCSHKCPLREGQRAGLQFSEAAFAWDVDYGCLTWGGGKNSKHKPERFNIEMMEGLRPVDMDWVSL